MNTLDFYCKLYSHLKNYGLPIWMMTPIRRIVRIVANKTIPHSFSKKHSFSSNRCNELIVSFTSFPARIDNVWQVVECIFRQTILPRKLILWLSEDQFHSTKDIPQKLFEMQNDIFEIRMVKGDIRSHKKYYYTCKESPESLVLLIDDDIYYSSNMIEELLKERYNTGRIICKYGFKIKRDNNGCLAPYETWDEVYKVTDGDDFFFGSGGGVLFRPSELYKDLNNIELAVKLTPLADDIWLNAMVRLADRKTHKISNGLFLPILQGVNDTPLYKSNIKYGNDEQIDALNHYYLTTVGHKIF